MDELIISVSGLRGIVGASLTPEVVTRYVTAFVDNLPPGALVVARDGRETGPLFRDVVHAVLTAADRSIVELGVAATPTVGVAVRRERAAGGIQISASHNPSEYNGLKLFDNRGQVLDAAAGQRVLECYHQTPSCVTPARRGEPSESSQAHHDHGQRILQTVDLPRVQSRRFRVLLDSNHGAGGLLGNYLLAQLGCQVESVGAEPTGQFAHPPEPTADHLQQVAALISRGDVDVGFCQDPDADRLAIIDRDGRYLGEEYTLAICLHHVLRHHSGPVVTNCATSRMSEDLAIRFGAPFFRSAVGEANVVECMRREGAIFGGEGNGGPIDPRVGYIRDSFVGMALVLDAMAERGMTVAELADELPRYSMHKTKVAIQPARIGPLLDQLTARFPKAAVDQLDGLRFDWDDSWVLIRASNTEPIVRVISEATSATAAESLCAEVGDLLRSC
ncbi:MAG: phosphoglucosamine mutase [Planctomycetaceae bacterium]|nr:phosphoglucosamine mutase [Planctomycetaceae bacterium]